MKCKHIFIKCFKWHSLSVDLEILPRDLSKCQNCWKCQICILFLSLLPSQVANLSPQSRKKYLPQKPSKLKILHRFDRNVWPRQGLVKLLLPAVSANTSWCLDSDLAKPTSELKILMFLSVFMFLCSCFPRSKWSHFSVGWKFKACTKTSGSN